MGDSVAYPNTEGFLLPFSHGVGYQDWIRPANPGANTNLSVPVSSNNWLRVLACVATITTDANAANRFVSLDFVNAQGVTFCRNGGGFVETATNNGVVYTWSAQRTDSTKATGTPALLPVFPMFLAPGCTVQLTVDNKQAGDTITSAILTVERFDTGPIGQAVGFVRNDDV